MPLSRLAFYSVSIRYSSPNVSLRTEPLTAADLKCDSALLISLNDDRTKTVSLIIPPPTLRDLIGIAATQLEIPADLRLVKCAILTQSAPATQH
jgi:hypothetical protein